MGTNEPAVQEPKAPETPPQGGEGTPGRITTQKKTDVKSFLEDSPLVEKKPAKKEGGKEDQPGEKKVILSPEQPAKKEPEPEPGKKEPETKEPETVEAKKGIIKIGEVEQSEEDWINAHNEVQNRASAWKALTQRSQVAASLTDEELKDILPYAHGSKKIPENIHEHLAKVGELPESFTFENEDGIEVEVKIKDIPSDILQKLKDSVFALSHRDLIEARLENDTLKSENQELRIEKDTANKQQGIRESISFMKKRPQFAVTLHEGDDLEEVLKTIKQVGKNHPEYDNVIRFETLGKYIMENGGTLDEAYNKLYAHKDREEEIAASITDNQNKPTHTKTGKTIPADENDQFLQKFSSTKSEKMANLGR